MWKCSKCAACCKVAGKFEKDFYNGKNMECKYLKDNLCSIYDKRPKICRVKDYNDEDNLNNACNYIRSKVWIR